MQRAAISPGVCVEHKRPLCGRFGFRFGGRRQLFVVEAEGFAHFKELELCQKRRGRLALRRLLDIIGKGGVDGRVFDDCAELARER